MAGNASKTALILGVTGQDGAHLAAALVDEGWHVLGGFRRGLSSKLWRLEELDIVDRVELVNAHLEDPYQILDVVAKSRPAQVYHLASESFVADSFEQARSTIEINTLGTLNVLEAIRIAAPETRLFFASSSEIFGAGANDFVLDEDSPFLPISPYGVSKLAAHHLVGIYRARYGLFASCGILFNHEGPLRARNFVTRKITYNLARLRVEGGKPMSLGNLEAERDWGNAEDYARAMPRVLALSEPADFVFGTGTATSVKRFLCLAAEAAGFTPVFEGEGPAAVCFDKHSGLRLAEVAGQYFRPTDTPANVGSPARLVERTGFAGSIPIERIAAAMMAADLDRRKHGRVHV